MLLLDDTGLDARRAVAGGSLAALAASLEAELAPLLNRDVYIPEMKALLSRAGGRCERDSTTLEFDPFSPDEHRCPKCGTVYRGETHHRAWIYPYQLWLAERAVHAALFGLLNKSAKSAQLGRDILRRYARAYLDYPNQDNVLGPTRLFFSTYLESIWLLQICLAADFLRAGGDAATADEVCDRIVQPSLEIIGQYDEGRSNRQVWNNAALLAGSLLLGDRERAQGIVGGIEEHLRHEVLVDGSWYEGENYHLFAHRGLWYGVTMAERAGLEFAPQLIAKFNEGFAVPFATVLPDLTLPARKDSQYAISVRQPRFAELCELGLARVNDRRLVSMLARLYGDDVPRCDTGRDRSTADVERNLPATSLSRADLGWRALVAATAELPPLERVPLRSAHLEGQGVTVFRRDEGRIYVAMDWGQSGGGHGHPDRLNVMFAHDDVRWLDDLGTGSYVDPSLHWYRSTLAHNAPLVNGKSQRQVEGRVIAYDERGGVGWLLAAVDGIAPGVHAERAIIVTPDYFIDELRWNADSVVRLELPVHVDAESDLAFSVTSLDGGHSPDDGFAFATAARGADVAKQTQIHFQRTIGNRTARTWARSESDATWFSAAGPGQPASAQRRFLVARFEGASGMLRSVWTWTPRVDRVTFSDDAVNIELGNEKHVHRRTPEYWSMEMTVGGAQSGIELYGWKTAAGPLSAPEIEPPVAEPVVIVRDGSPLTVQLGEAHYRRSEDSWRDAGRPTATLTFQSRNERVELVIRVPTPEIVFVERDATNPLDNEHPDINGHCVYLYVNSERRRGGWSVAPDHDSPHARVRSLHEWGALPLANAEWSRTSEGFEIRVAFAADDVSSIDVLVNDIAPHRARRRGQLVLSGGRGEFVYLRGDRHDPERLVPLRIQ